MLEKHWKLRFNFGKKNNLLLTQFYDCSDKSEDLLEDLEQQLDKGLSCCDFLARIDLPHIT